MDGATNLERIMKPRTPRTNLLELAKRAKRAGYPLETVTKNLKPEYQPIIPEMESAYNSTRTR